MHCRKFVCWLVCTILSVILIVLLFASAKAALIDADMNGHLTPRYPKDNKNRKYRVNLRPVPAASMGGWGIPQVELNLLQAAFPAWNFILGGPKGGDLKVVHYDAHVDKDLPNFFRVDYYSDDGLPGGWVWQWMQIIITNDPVPAAPGTTYIDPQPNDDNMPFYWTEAERVMYTNCPGGVDLRFEDRPSRPLKDAPVDWTAHLYLVYWDQLNPGDVRICNGTEWGFQIRWICNATGPNVSAGVAGDKFESEEIGIHFSDPTYPRYTPCDNACIGGITVPIESFSLAGIPYSLSLYFGISSTIFVATAAIGICIKRAKARRAKRT